MKAAIALLWSSLAMTLCAQLPETTEVEETNFKVEVVDDKGSPIPQAQVAITGWEAEGKSMGVAIEYKPVQPDGVIRLQLPADAEQVRVSAKAKGFSQRSELFTLSGGGGVVKLKAGRIVRVRAVDEAGEVVSDAFPLLEDSRILGREFKADVDCWVSPDVKPERHWMRVAAVGDDGALLFSDLINVSLPESSGEDGVIEAVMKPGIKVIGKLDAMVPRPVANGFVEICIAEATNHRIPRSTKPRNEYDKSGFKWEQKVPVKEDGTFEIESLPAGGHLQLFALVDGYQSKIPSIKELATYLEQKDAGGEETLEWATRRNIRPQIFPLVDNDTDGIIELTVPCVPTTELVVKVVTPANEPIPGATIKLNPNGIFLFGGLFIPGWQWGMDQMVHEENLFNKCDLQEWVQQTLLSPQTDETGIARISVPGVGRESFAVVVDGYVMPGHPLARTPTENRNAVISLTPGTQLQRTITMERAISSIEREVLVVDTGGKPLSNLQLTALEVEFEGNEGDWQYWSVQRFGSFAKATTSDQGKAVLQLPSTIEKRSVGRYRIHVEGKLNRNDTVDRRDAYVRDSVIVPHEDDGGVVTVTVSEEPPPTERHAYWQATASYVDLRNSSPSDGRELIEQMIARPTLVSLKQLLAINNYDSAVPLALDGEFNRLAPWDKKTPIAVVHCGEATRVVVLCSVRPKGATWTTKPEGRFPPETAFIFDIADGTLIAALGGGQSSRGSYDNVSITNIGGSNDDVFVQVYRFEKREENMLGSRWYRLARAELGPSLSIQHDANGNPISSWSLDASPPAEFGFLEYVSKGKEIPDRVLGELGDGVKVLRKLYWDSERNQFVGPLQQYVDGNCIYKVLADRSEEFTYFEPTKRDLVVGGGRYDYKNWHMWDVSVPDERSATLVLRLRTLEDGKESKQTLASVPLNSGACNLVNFQVDPDQQTEDSSVIRLHTNLEGDEHLKQTFTVPRVAIDASPSVTEQPVLRRGEEAVHLWIRATTKDGKETTVELVAEAEATGR